MTQLSEIEPKSAIAYIREVARKYPPGARIADVPSNGDLRGKILNGQLILEVPVQFKAIPRRVLDAAKTFDVKIRDIAGQVYNP